MVIDGRVLFYKCIGLRDIGFGLVVILIGNEVLNGILRKESFKLGVQLSGQYFIWGDYKGGPLKLFNYIGYRVGFTGAGYAKQNL